MPGKKQQTYKGMVQVFTGKGRGKTTAALGTALRAAGAGLRVAWVAFDKGGEGHYAERHIIRKRLPQIKLFITGLDRMDPKTGKFRRGVNAADRKEGSRGLKIVQRLFKDKRYVLIVLDEINSSAALGIVKIKDVLNLLKKRPKDTEVILTGRDAPASFLRLADLVTEMKLVKHYFYRGVAARRGFDY